MTTESGATKKEPTPKAAAKAVDKPADKAADKTAETTSKSEGSAPSNYSRGEGQKPVSAAYKENWNAIFGDKKKKSKPSKSKSRR